ncbi:MAG: DUF6077 domain-containing protein [Eubacteriales bacterium]|nr:DUF6077 domain-containing protein [Eubacteriales bacterium]
MIVYKICMIFAVLIGLPMLLGLPLALPCPLYKNRTLHVCAFAYLMGMLLMLAEMQLTAVPLVLQRRSLTAFIAAFFALAAGTVLVEWLFVRKRLSGTGNLYGRLRKKAHKKDVWTKGSVLLLAAVILLFAVMAGQYVLRMHVDDDDARYIGNAVDAWYTDTMYQYSWNTGEFIGDGYYPERDLVSPWVMTFALLAKVIRIHPAVAAHTILPFFLFFCCILAYFLIGDVLMKQECTKTLGFLLAVEIVLLTFGGNTHTQAAVTLVRIWQGKALFAAVVIPALFLLYFLLADTEKNRVVLYLCMWIACQAGCYLSGVGIVGSGLLAGPFCFWDILLKRRWKELPLVVLVCLPTLVYGWLYWKMKG